MSDAPAKLTSAFPDPETVVQRQLDAYNARDLDALLAIYADDVEVYEFPSVLVASGCAALRERFQARFQEPNLHATLRNRMVIGNRVVDFEEVRRTFPEGPGTLQLIMIYEVREGRIARAWSMAGAKILTQ